MPSFIRPNSSSTGQASGTVMLMLALNLIVLAFFILLNAMATDTEAKAKAAYDSLKQGFSSQQKGVGLGDADTDDRVPPWQIGLNANLQGVLHNALQISTPDMKADADQIALMVPGSAVFAPAGAEFLPGGKALVENMIGITKGKADKPVFRVSFVVRMPAADAKLAALRLLAVHDVLASAGADATLFTAGVAVADKDVLEIALAPVAEDYTVASAKMGQVTQQSQKVGAEVKAVGKPEAGGR